MPATVGLDGDWISMSSVIFPSKMRVMHRESEKRSRSRMVSLTSEKPNMSSNEDEKVEVAEIEECCKCELRGR